MPRNKLLWEKSNKLPITCSKQAISYVSVSSKLSHLKNLLSPQMNLSYFISKNIYFKGSIYTL